MLPPWDKADRKVFTLSPDRVESCYIMWSICKYSCDIIWWNVIIADLMCALWFMNSLSFPYYDTEIVWEIKSWCFKEGSEERERGSNMGFVDRMEGWIHFLLPYSFLSTFSLTPLSLLSPFIFWHRNAPLNWLFVTFYAYRLPMIRMPVPKNKDFYRDVLFTKLIISNQMPKHSTKLYIGRDVYGLVLLS